MYQALYRKWRPQNFSSMVGQEAITGALLSQVQTGRIAHAYIFTGTRGTGKTTCAKVLAKAVNCENLQQDGPCGECPCCLGIENGSMLDVSEIDAASNNGVDDVRNLREETVYRPGRGQYKVYIIDEVHMLSIQAFNALLKILEEPPSHVIFILATTEIHKVPATILSRCQRYDFLRISHDDIKQRLLDIAGKEGLDLHEEAASLLATLGDGSMRDALSLLDTCATFDGAISEEHVRTMAGVTDKSHLFSIGRAATQGDISELLCQVSALRERSVDIKRLTEELVGYYRNCLLAIANQSGSLLEFLPKEERERYVSVGKEMTEAGCIRALRRLADALDRMGRSPNARVELELALFDIALYSKPVPQQAEKQSDLPLGSLKQESKVQVSYDTTPQAASSPPQAASSPPQAASSPPQAASSPPQAMSLAPQAASLAPQAMSLAPQAASSAPQAASSAPQATPSALSCKTGEVEPFLQWPQVVERIGQMDQMVYSFVKKTKAYFDGKHILLDGGDVFLEFMRSNQNVSEVIKTAIQEVIGERYGIGPYQKEQVKHALEETTKRNLSEWQEKGVAIKYTNTEEN